MSDPDILAALKAKKAALKKLPNPTPEQSAIGAEISRRILAMESGGKRDPLADGANLEKRDPSEQEVATPPTKRAPESGFMTAARQGAQSALGNFGNELLTNWQTGMDTLTGREPDAPRAPGSDAPWSAARDFEEGLAQGAKDNPKSALVGRVGGPGVRYAALGLLAPGLSGALAAAPAAAKVAGGVALGAGETALQEAGDAPEGERTKAALQGAGDATLSPEGMATNAMFATAGPLAAGLRPEAKVLVQKALETRLLAAGMKPGALATLKADLGDDFTRWAQEFWGMKFHERPGAVKKFLPTSARYSGDRAAEARRTGERGLDVVEGEATARNVTTDPEELISAYEGRAAALEKPGATPLRQERKRWTQEAEALKKERRPQADPDVEEIAEGPTEPESFSTALRAKRAEGQAGYDELLRGEGARSREARIRAGLRKEQLTEALPPDLREAWERANKDYSMGKAGEDAANHGALAAEIQHPRQALRDLTRATAPMQGEEKILPGLGQLALDKIMSNFGYDMRARLRMAQGQRALTGKPSVTGSALTHAAPGATAESIRREIERQRIARENTP